MKEEKLLRAVGDVGDDLIHMADTRTFRPAAWRRILPAAACFAVILALGALTVPKLLRQSQPEPNIQLPPKQEVTTPIPGEMVVLPVDPTQDDAEGSTFEVVALPQSWTASLGQVVFRETVYYGQEILAAEQAAPYLDEQADTIVEEAEQAAWKDGAVYEKLHTDLKVRRENEMVDMVGGSINTEIRGGYAVLPEELYVELSDGTYLRCRTAWLPAGALLKLDLAAPDTGRLLAWLIEPLEQWFGGEEMVKQSDLTTAGAEALFFALLEAEHRAGFRTEELDQALWYDEEAEAFVIPRQDVLNVLERYLEKVSVHVENMEHYDRDRNALVTETLQGPERELSLSVTEWTDLSSDTLRCSVFVNDGGSGYYRIYTFRITDHSLYLQQVVRKIAE